MGRDFLHAVITPPGGEGGKVLVGCVHLESLSNHDMRLEQLESITNIIGKTGLPGIFAGDFNFCSFWDYGEMERKLREKKKKFALALSPAHFLSPGSGGEAGGGGGGAAAAEPAEPIALIPREAPDQAWPPKATEQAQASVTLQGWADCFEALHGPTTLDNPAGFTFDTFRNLMLHNHEPERMRYDRVVARLPPAHFTLSACAVCGTEPIPGGANAGGGAGDCTPPRGAIPIYLSDHFAVEAKWLLQ